MITLTAVSGAERKPDGKSSAVGPASHQSFNGATKKTRKPSPTCDRTYKQRKRLHLQRGEKGGILSSWCLGISALISVERGRGLCLGGSYVHVMTPLQLTAFLDVCSKAETAKWGRAQFIPLPPTFDKLWSIASKNLVLSMQMALIWQFLFPPCHCVKGPRCKTWENYDQDYKLT